MSKKTEVLALLDNGILKYYELWNIPLMFQLTHELLTMPDLLLPENRQKLINILAEDEYDEHFLPIKMNGVTENNFKEVENKGGAMIIEYEVTSTEPYNPKDEIKQIINQNPN